MVRIKRSLAVLCRESSAAASVVVCPASQHGSTLPTSGDSALMGPCSHLLSSFRGGQPLAEAWGSVPSPVGHPQGYSRIASCAVSLVPSLCYHSDGNDSETPSPNPFSKAAATLALVIFPITLFLARTHVLIHSADVLRRFPGTRPCFRCLCQWEENQSLPSWSFHSGALGVCGRSTLNKRTCPRRVSQIVIHCIEKSKGG